MTRDEIDALIKRADIDGLFEVFSYSIEIPSPTGFEIAPDMYFYLGKLIAAAAAAAYERAAGAVCVWCKQSEPIVNGQHFVDDGRQERGTPGRWVRCGAAAIRALA